MWLGVEQPFTGFGNLGPSAACGDFALVGGELVIAPPSSAGAVGVDLHVNLRGPVCPSGLVHRTELAAEQQVVLG